MNKSLALTIGILAVIALAVWFFTDNPSMSQTGSSATTSSSSVQIPSQTKTGTKTSTKGVPNSTTYKSLLTQAGSYECDYSSVQASGQTANVIYIYGGKMRGEFRTTEAGGTSNANLFVYDGHNLYQWKEGSSIGTRTVLTSLSQLPLIIPKDLTSGAIIGNNYTSVGWLCHTWLTNKALLTPPSYVTFS
jgi:hypothetical protein